MQGNISGVVICEHVKKRSNVIIFFFNTLNQPEGCMKKLKSSKNDEIQIKNLLKKALVRNRIHMHELGMNLTYIDALPFCRAIDER